LHHPDRQDLIELVEPFLPLKYLAGNEKRINYMKQSQAQIVCQLLKPSLDFDGLDFENVIVHDSNHFHDPSQTSQERQRSIGDAV
jgi:hypothetical protein